MSHSFTVELVVLKFKFYTRDKIFAFCQNSTYYQSISIKREKAN
jgi:hypothetical protein